MADFEGKAYQTCKEWIANKRDKGHSWEDIDNLCVSNDEFDEQLEMLKDTEMFPLQLNRKVWLEFVEYYKAMLIPVTVVEGQDVIAIDTGKLLNQFQIPTGVTSSWDSYKSYLSKRMSPESVANIQKSCHWILNHLSNETRTYGEIKGLVTGSVQSGKTANMEGLISMAADYDWNFFIVLSGTIDNLRIQTRDRFKKDLRNSEGVLWNIIDFTAEDKKMLQEELKLNSLTGNKNYANRYLTVCLKNKVRLERLIDWLYSNPMRATKLRIIVIDDEADQASINTAEITPEEEQERCAINQLIVNLVNGKKSDGSTPSAHFQAMNYISYTATPYANVLNEGPGESLYPKDFVCTLPEAHEYFGAKVIFGNEEEGCQGFPILRLISPSEEDELKLIHKERLMGLPESMKDALSWFLCATALQRHRGIIKPVSMLVHTASIQNHHFVIYDRIQFWLTKKTEVLERCEKIYDKEIDLVTLDDLREANPKYGFLNEISEDYPPFGTLRKEIDLLLSEVCNIGLGDDKQLEYTEGIHLCVDNCKAAKVAEEGTYLRIVYPTDEQLSKMRKAPAFIVIGGNTLSRGLTIEGLVCTYFSRTSNMADTLMQMARWFGYRRGYELLQRIWMTLDDIERFEALTKIDMDLKREVERFMEKGISPSKFGPRIRNIPEIAKFRVTSKNKQQRAEYDDFDFCGDSYETTDFENSGILEKNFTLTEEFLSKLSISKRPRKSTTAKGWIWDDVPYRQIRDDYLVSYSISGFSSLKSNLPFFTEWIEKMNDEGKFIDWNTALIDGDNHDLTWKINDEIEVGKIERTKKVDAKHTDKKHIDIGALRSGLDALCDVDETTLSEKQITRYEEIRKSKKDIISGRSDLNLEDKPLLLIYLIKKDGGTPRANSKHRAKLDALADIVGISIIVPGDSIGESHAKSLRIKIEEEPEDA